MTAKKKPMTKKESNRLYLERKKAKEVASVFEAALEPPASAQTIEAEPVVDVEDGDLYEPYAPKAGAVPLAAGETQETAPQPGDWSVPPPKEDTTTGSPPPSPIIEQTTAIGDMALESPETPLQRVERGFGTLTPEHLSKWLELASDAIKWLASRDRHLDSRQKAVLQSRLDSLASIRYQLK